MIDGIFDDMLPDGIPSQPWIQLLTNMFSDSDDEDLAEAVTDAESQAQSKRPASSQYGPSTKEKQKRRNGP
jgi:hypothetical protein